MPVSRGSPWPVMIALALASGLVLLPVCDLLHLCGCRAAWSGADAHCNALLECVQASGCSGQDCAEACRPVFDEHSSGLGMLIQLGECMSGTCGEVCSFGSGNATVGEQ